MPVPTSHPGVDNSVSESLRTHAPGEDMGVWQCRDSKRLSKRVDNRLTTSIDPARGRVIAVTLRAEPRSRPTLLTHVTIN